MYLLKTLRSSSLWFVLPSLVLVAAMGATISGYDPLSFDPSLYQTKEALAADLDEVVPDEPDKGQRKSVGEGGASGKSLTDGTYTGYAACGQGNPKGWQPYYVAVTIEVAGGKVSAITDIHGTATGGEGMAALAWDAAESQEYLDRAINGNGADGIRAQMESQISSTGAVSAVDAVSGATFSSTAIYNAYLDAVAKAGGEATGSGSAPASGNTEPQAKSDPVTVADDSSNASYADGDWTGYAVCGEGNEDDWSPYYVAVTVRVQGGKPQSVTDIHGSATGDEGSGQLSWNESESGRYLGWAKSGRDGSSGLQAQMNDQLASAGKVQSIDTVSGATFSSRAIAEAYRAALRKAAEAAGADPGSGPDAPDASDPPGDDQDPQEEGEEADVPATDGADLADGDWTGYAVCGEGNEDDWSPYYVAVTVRVKGGKPQSVRKVWGSATGDEGSKRLSWNESESGRYLGWATSGRGGKKGLQAQMNDQLASAGKVGSVDVVSGATFSSRAIAGAYGAALRKAAEAAGADPGSGPDVPDASDPSGDDQDPSGGEDEDDEGDEDVSATDGADLEDGGWTGYAVCGEGNEDDWSPYYVAVTVTVKDGKVTNVDDVKGSSTGDEGSANLSWSEDDNGRYLEWAKSGRTRGGVEYAGVLDQIRDALKSDTSLSGVDTVSGATYSSRAIVKACVAALKKSAEAAGSAYDEPEDGGGDSAGDDSGDDGHDASDDGQSDDGQSDDGTDDTPQAPLLVDGEYTGHALCEDPTYEDDWDAYYVLLTIKVEGGVITQITSTKPDEAGEIDPSVTFDPGNQYYFNRALNGTDKRAGIPTQIQAKLDAGTTVTGIDTVSGATFSSRAIIEAFNDAVAKVPQAQGAS